jgi:four helix bundle protein
MTQHHWKDLVVWQKAHLLVLEIYSISEQFPESEKYNLTSQIKRSITSVPINIVEGHDRNSLNEFVRFLYISRGSLEETRYLLLLAKDLLYIDKQIYDRTEAKCSEISIQINKLIQSIKKI